MIQKRKDSGVALLLVMVTLFLMAILGYEIYFSSNVESRISANARNRLQATYLAQSALRISFLRLQLYKEAKNLAEKNKQIPIPSETLDQIWSLAFPPLPLQGMKVSWPGEVMALIQSDGSKIPINLLDANKHRRSDDAKAKTVREQIIGIFKGLSEDEDFDKLYRGLEAEELVDNIKDWIDSDDDKTGGGDERSDYQRFDPPYVPRNDRIPTLSELHMIKGWSDDLIQRVAGNFSVFNLDTEVNPNFISLARLKAQCPNLQKEDLMAIQKKRFESPFKNLDELFSFIQGPEIRNGRDCQKGNLVDSTRETNFIIEGTGIVGDARRSIKLYVRIPEERKTGTNPAPAPSTSSSTTSGGSSSDPALPKKEKLPLAEPRIVFVEESV